MGKKRKFIGERCVYCPCDAQSSDHVPPKNLFPKPRPSDLVEVPSCNNCNHGASNDDEYFRTVLATFEVTGDHPDVQRVLPDVHRALNNPKKKGFARSFIKTIQLVQRVTPSGLYAGVAPTFSFDKGRLLRVVERTVKGLLSHERGIRLPESCEAVAYFGGDIVQDISPFAQSLRRVAEYMATRPHKTIGNNVFAYSVVFAEDLPEVALDDEHFSIWLMRFYDAVDFLCMTRRKVVAEEGAVKAEQDTAGARGRLFRGEIYRMTGDRTSSTTPSEFDLLESPNTLVRQFRERSLQVVRGDALESTIPSVLQRHVPHGLRRHPVTHDLAVAVHRPEDVTVIDTSHVFRSITALIHPVTPNPCRNTVMGSLFFRRVKPRLGILLYLLSGSLLCCCKRTV